MRVSTKVSIIVLPTLILMSCSPNGITQGRLGIGKTAAQKALTPQAYATALVPPYKLKPGRIYKVAKGGDFHEICQNDFKQQPKLASITTTAQDPSADIVQDEVLLSGLQVQALGFSLGPTYDRVRVTGFQEIDAAAPAADDVPQYIRANLGPNCPSILARNKPYFIVSGVAVGKKVEELRKIGVSLSKASVFGIGGSYTPGDESVVNTRTNVVFGANGEMVKK